MKNPITWFEIYVDDMHRATAFYSSVFAIELNDLLDPTGPPDNSLQMKAFPSDMESHGASGSLVCVEGMPAGQNSVLVYFSCEDCEDCEDCEVEESRIEPVGGTIVRPKFSIGDYGFITLAKDTEGNMFGLHSLS